MGLQRSRWGIAARSGLAADKSSPGFASFQISKHCISTHTAASFGNQASILLLFAGQCALSCWCGEENKTRLHPVRGYHKDAIELPYTPSCPGTFRFQLSEALLFASWLFLLNPCEKLSKTVVYPPGPLDREGSTSMECALPCLTLAELWL